MRNEWADHWAMLDRAKASPIELDQLRFIEAKLAYERGFPERVAALLARMSGAWKSSDPQSACQLRQLIDFVQVNGVAADFPHARVIAGAAAPAASPSVGKTGADWSGFLLGF